MDRSFFTSVLVGVGLLTVSPALAHDASLSGNVALTSDYVFWGVFQSDENPAIQGRFDYTTWNVGGALSADGFGFDLRYHPTDIDGLAIADDRVVFTIRRSLRSTRHG